MALVAHVTAANGGRIVEKLLNKSAGKVALPKGARIEIIDTETGAPVHARSAQTTGEGLLLKFVTAEGEVALELSGDISAFAAMPLDGQAATDAAAPADGEAAAAQAGATTEAASTDDGEDRGMSPVLLGILGLGVLGGIAAAASGGGDKEAPKDTVAPNAPAGLDLASADDTGASTSDNITRNTSGLTIAGTAEANSKVELFNGATSLGTATADASGNFTLDVSLAAGTHSITAKATDAAGNVSVASTALSITVDTTAPTAAIAISDTQLTSGETAVVTITFSEPVVDFTAADLTVGSGTLGPLVSSNNGLTWTATFTAAADVTDATNVIALGTGYSDVAGNAGTAASSPNYVVDAISFEVVQPDPDTVDFGGTATGPITITLNAQDEATFSRDGKTAVATIPGISTKVMNVPQGGVLNIVLDGEVTSDTFTLNAPNAAAMIFTGNGGNLSDTLNVIIESASADPDLRTLKVDTSGLTGVEAIRFAFPQDARDVVKLTADSKLTGFSTIEVSKGGVDLTSISVQPGVEFIVNSTLIVTLTQFEEMSSLISVTGLGQLVINLTADEVASGALEAFLSSADEKPILIGTTVTVMDPDGQPLDVPEALAAISYPGIPELSDRLDALEGQLADLAIGDVAGLAAALSSLGGAITALQTSTGEEDAALSARIDELEGQLDGIAGTVVAYVDAQIAGLQLQIDGLGIEDVAELSTMLASIDEAISALQSSTGSETSALSERITALETKLAGIADTVVAYVDEQIAGLQTQIDGLAIDDIAELATTLGTISDAITALQGSTTSIETTIGHPADPDATPPVLATGLYLAIEGAVSALAEEVDAQIVDLQSQIDGLAIEDIAGLANSLSSINEAITALQGSAAGFETTIGHPADPDATPPVLATGIYLAIEGAVSALAEEIDTQIADLQSQIDDLSTDDIAGLSTLLSSLNDTVSELSQLTGEGGAIDERLIALEGKLAGVTSTVIAYVDEQIDLLKDDAAGDDPATLDSIAGLRAAIEALLDGSGLGDPATEGTIAYQLAALQSQIDALIAASGGDETAPTVLDVHLASATGADDLGHLDGGDIVTASVTFSEAVLVTGNPTLRLTIGDGDAARQVDATLVGGAGTNVLTFAYTVDGEDWDSTGISIGEDALHIGEDSSITDKAGNALVRASSAVPDDENFIIDNGPLELSLTGRQIFGGVSGEDASIIIGFLTSGYEEETDPVSFEYMGYDGSFVVPDGMYFIPFDNYLDAFIGEDGPEYYDEQWFLAHAIAGGETVSFDLDEYVVLESEGSILVSEAALRQWLSSEYGQSLLDDSGMSADAFINAFARSFAGASSSSVLSQEFLALIEGRYVPEIHLEVTTALTVAQATALAAAGFDLEDNVDYDIRDYYTTVQAALSNADQQAALENADRVISRGDELDNVVSMTAFNWNTYLRSELGAGDDTYNSGRGQEEIVGQQGADTINLTYHDASPDGIVYQTAYDGQTASIVSLTYSTDGEDYREGSRVSVTINDHHYTYITGEDGETADQALQHLADTVMAKQVTGRVVIGVSYSFEPTDDTLVETLVYQDEMVDGTYTVKPGEYFLSVTDYLRTITRDLIVDDQNLFRMALSGGQTFTLGDEDYLELEAEYLDYVGGYDGAGEPVLLHGQTVLADPATYLSFLDHSVAVTPRTYEEAQDIVEAAIRYRDVADVRLAAGTGKLTFIGGSYDHEMAISPGIDYVGYGEDGDAIVNPGQAAIASVTFFGEDGEDYYPELTNAPNTTSFDRELRVTISGKTITANVVPNDPIASVAALKAAIEAAMNVSATSAITAATASVDLLSLGSEEAEINGYEVTLVVNGRTITLKSDADGDVGDLIEALEAVPGVQSVELDGTKLVLTAEVRGTVASENSINFTDFKLSGTPYASSSTEAVGGSLSGLVSAVNILGTTITITGFVPESDDDAPTITVDSAEIDGVGVQQVVKVAFSDMDTDYYEGGSLLVTINGEDYSAPMAATGGTYNALSSLYSLASAINTAAGLDPTLLIELAYVGEDGDDWALFIRSADEAPDALKVSAIEQSYRGEEQTATITLEDALVYGAQAGEDAATANRFADVYFEGGKVHATFVPRVSNGSGGLMNGEPVTVSADMVVKAGSTTYSAPYEQYNNEFFISLDSFSLTIGSHTYTQDDLATYLETINKELVIYTTEPANAATFLDMMDWLETLDGVARVEPAASGGGFTIHYDVGVSGSIDDFDGNFYNTYMGNISSALDWMSDTQISNEPGGGDPEATAQALADAINAATHTIVHFAFNMGSSEPLTLETLLQTADDIMVTLDVLVDGTGGYYDYDGDDAEVEGVETVGDLIDWLNAEYAGAGTWSLNAAGNGFDLKVTPGAEVLVNGSISVGLSTTVLESSSSTDEGTLPFIGHAVADGASITVTAAEVGKDTFRVTDVTADYEGVHQIATAHFDGSGSYYEGGVISLEVDPTPGLGEDNIRISANMVAGDRLASLQNLVDEINSRTVEDADTAARISISLPLGISGDTVNDGDDLDTGLYIASWSVTVGAVTYWGRGEAVVDGGTTSWSNLGTAPTQFNDLAAFVTYLGTLEGIASAEIVDGEIIVTSDETGSDAYLGLSVEVPENASVLEGASVISVTRQDYGSSGELHGVIDHAELSSDGTITLVSADATRHQFSITDADRTTQPVQQKAAVDYSGSDDRYYEGGKIGLTVNGVTIETDMVLKPATSTLSGTAQTSSALDLVPIFSADHVIGSYLTAVFSFSITIDGTTHTEAEFLTYLEELSSPLVLPTDTGYTEPAPTFQTLADWISTLDGVSHVSIDDDHGFVVTYDEGVTGTIDSLGGNAYVDNAVLVNLNLAYAPLSNDPAGEGDAAATLQALRDAIWDEVNTNNRLVIDIDDSLTETSSTGNYWQVRTDATSIFPNNLTFGDTLGGLLAGLESLEEIESAELVDGKIIITAAPGQESFNLEISSSLLFPDAAAELTVGAVYHAFSSVKVENGSIVFVAADPVDGYGEINISDAYMSVAAQEQITRIGFGDADLATGLRNENDEAADVSVSVAGQTITAKTQENDYDTIRALAQAIIEARDGEFAEDVATVGAQDRAAVVRIELPDGVDSDTRLIKDEAGHNTELTFEVKFAETGEVFSYVPSTSFNMSIDDLIEDLNNQFEEWAANHMSSPVGTFSYDADSNAIVIASADTGDDAFVGVENATITQFWDNADNNISDGSADAALNFSDEAVTGGGGAIRINVTRADDVFYDADGSGLQFDGEDYSEAPLASEQEGLWSRDIRFEMHLTFVDAGGSAYHWDYYSAPTGEASPGWMSGEDLAALDNTQLGGPDGNITLSDIVRELNTALATELAGFGTIAIDPATGQIVVTPSTGYSVSLGGATAGMGNDLRIDSWDATGDQWTSLVVNDDRGLRVNIPDEFFSEIGEDEDAVRVDGVTLFYKPLSTNMGGGSGWIGEIDGVLDLLFETGTGFEPVFADFHDPLGPLKSAVDQNHGNNDGHITLNELVAYLDEQVPDELGSVTIQNGDIVIMPAQGVTVAFNATGMDFSFSEATGLAATASYNLNGSIAEDDSLGETVINLPVGVTGGSVIHGIEGGYFTLDEAAIDIRVTFTVNSQDYHFTVPGDLDQDMTVSQFIADLNNKLTEFETDNSLGDVGAFSFDTVQGQISFTPATANLALTSYQFNAFNISEFTETLAITGLGGTAAIGVTGQEDQGESGALVLHSADRAITAQDALAMDLVKVTLTLDGQEVSHTYRPELIETPGQAGSTVGSFLTWLEEAFGDYNVHGKIIDGDVVLTGTDLEDADISLHLLDVAETLTSSAVGVTGPTGGASGGSITLAQFSGLDGSERLLGESVDFEIYIGGGTGAQVVSFHYEIEETSTVADLLDYIGERAFEEMGEDYIDVSLDDGLVLSANGLDSMTQLWVSDLSLTVEKARATAAVTAVRDVLGTVDFNGEDYITLHASETGPDALLVNNASYDKVDVANSEYQEVSITFDNSKLDGIGDGYVVSVTLLGTTTSLTVNTSGENPDGHLDLTDVTPNSGRSSAILDQLITSLLADHSNDAVGTIVRGYRDGDGIFHEDSSATSTVLLITASEYGDGVLGTAADGSIAAIEAKIVDPLNPIPAKFTQVADELQAGTVTFIGSSEGTEIHDKSYETGAQTGRNESVVHYEQGIGGEDASGVYVLDDITDDLPGVTLSGTETEEFDDLDIEDDIVEGVSPGVTDESFVNPGGGATGTAPGYYGEGASSGEDGVDQTYTNPDGGYAAIDNSPVHNSATGPAGEDSYYGGASGYYDADGHLHTDHLDGATAQAGASGGTYYDVDKGLESGTAVTGAYHDEVTDSDSLVDGLHGDPIQEGFAAFTWDEVYRLTTATASHGPDVINNFQSGNDVILFEGAIEESLISGYVDHVYFSDVGRSIEASFDLDENEFGLISSNASWLGTGEITDALKVSEMLTDIFELTANGEDEEINTSVFAISADNDRTTTAIWAHTQSYEEDDTIDADELTLLAIVHTTGSDFAYEPYNLMLMHHDNAPG